jgi:cellulose biosynthesis protein BcsQ
MTSTILFTAGAKGVSGKSTAARFVITYLRDHGANPLLLDLDDENKTLSRFFPEAIQVEMKKTSSHDILVEKVLGSDQPLVLADLKAGRPRGPQLVFGCTFR